MTASPGRNGTGPIPRNRCNGGRKPSITSPSCGGAGPGRRVEDSLSLIGPVQSHADPGRWHGPVRRW